MKCIGLLIFCLFFIQNVRGQDAGKTVSSEDKKLIAQLKADEAFRQVNCVRGWEPNPIAADARIRLEAVRAFGESGQQAKLKRECGTIEGDPVYSYLTVEKGKAELVFDTTQDKFGSKRIYSYQCTGLEVGIYFDDLKAGKRVFRKIAGNEDTEQQLVLRCRAGSKELIF